MPKIKICGITNFDDAAMAVKLGADALGFIFAPSPREISPENARDIIKKLSPFIKSVGVFVNENENVINEIIEYCGIDIVQLHGDESPGMCSIFMPRTVKAFRVKDKSTLEDMLPYVDRVRAFLLDTYSREAAGGTGKVFNWDIAGKTKVFNVPLILAGGLTPDNIKDAVNRVNPYALDVNSGIEASPGKKDHGLMRELFNKLGEIENRK
ncbi:phosphoribosylanthranilate isomerase [Thermodesulfobacteriota bacterium]